MKIQVNTEETVVVTDVVLAMSIEEAKDISSMLAGALFIKEDRESAHAHHVTVKHNLYSNLNECLEGY